MAITTRAVSGRLMSAGILSRIRVRLILSMLLALASSLLQAADAPANTVLITGSNRGIGFEFVRQYAAAGWQVIATCRDPDGAGELRELAADNPRVVVEQLDVTESASIESLRRKYADTPIRLLINNAALLGPRDAQAFGAQDFSLAADQYAVNALGPLRVSSAFIANVRAAGPGKIIALGSAAGSNGYLQPPADFFTYRASKAALHFLMHNLALELADERIVVGLINPGLVDTRGLADIGPDDPVPADFVQVVRLIRAGVIELTSPEDSVAAMIKLIDSLGMEQSGTFLNFDGQVVPW